MTSKDRAMSTEEMEDKEHNDLDLNIFQDHIRRDECPLGMKFAIFFDTNVKQLPEWWLGTLVHEDEEDSFGLSLHHWLCFMAIMGEDYAHGPESQQHHLAQRPDDMQWVVRAIDDDLDLISELPAGTKEQFRASLSEGQLRAWETLRDWWDAAYQDPALPAAARLYLCTYPETDVDILPPGISSYHLMCIGLWRREFCTPHWEAVLRSDPKIYLHQTSYRKTANMHAMAQKAGLLVLQHAMKPERGVEEEEKKEQSCYFRYGRALQDSYDESPWLPRVQRGRCTTDAAKLPLYLWDREMRRTRKVSELLQHENTPVAYTCISHTWGRWKKRPVSLVRLDGVDWAIPENTLFEVTDLPQLLNHTPAQTRFLWFDLLCLPQDTTTPEYVSEVGRQATIFYHATACIAWINQATSWRNTQATIRWLVLNYLCASSEVDIYHAAPLLQEAERAVGDGHIELRGANSPYNVDPWLSSTWTLQESSLCPDITFCNRDWQPLELVPGTTLSLHQLMTLYHADRFATGGEAHYKRHAHAEAELLAIKKAVAGPLPQLNRCAILDLGARRTCQKRRAEAVMSALGVTDWYDAYVRDHEQRPPPDENLVLGSYTLPFVREAAAKMGAEFFMASCTVYDEGRIWPPGPDYRGTFLPFGVPQNDLGLLSFNGPESTGYQSHPSIKSWSIEADGSVKIPEASVLASSDRYPDDLFSQLEEEEEEEEEEEQTQEQDELSSEEQQAEDHHRHNVAPESVVTKFHNAMSSPREAVRKLWGYLTEEEEEEEVEGLPDDGKPPQAQAQAQAKRVAIVLATGPGGVVVAGLQHQLEQRREHGESGETRWIRIFIHSIGASLSIPEPEPLDMVVL